MDMPNYPEPEKDVLVAFVYHSLRLDRVPTNRETIERTLHRSIGPDSDPYVAGHGKSLALIFQIADDENLLPKVNNVFELDTVLPWLKRLHRNLTRSLAEFGALALDSGIIKLSQIGEFRQTAQTTESPFGTISAPNQYHIRELVMEWANELNEFENKHMHEIRGTALSYDTAELFVDKAYEMSLKLAAIKPFEDQNNSMARLVENLLRLHWGMPWKITVESKRDEYAEELRDVMKTYEDR